MTRCPTVCGATGAKAIMIVALCVEQSTGGAVTRGRKIGLCIKERCEAVGSKYAVYMAKYPYKGYWEDMHNFDTFDLAIEFVKAAMEKGYDIIDIHCRDIKESEDGE